MPTGAIDLGDGFPSWATRPLRSPDFPGGLPRRPEAPGMGSA